MTVIVTGASGFIGLNVVERLLAQGRDVVALSHDELPEPARADFAALPGRLTAARADIAAQGTLEALFAAHRVEAAIHLAAVTAAADAPPSAAARILDVNVVGSLALFEAARAAGLRRVVYASSGAVYGNAVFRAAASEDTPPEPATLYALTKLIGERLASRFRAAHGLDVVSARLAAVFGPWERDTGLRATLSPPWQIARKALAGEEAVLAARGIRDWIYGRDIARGLVALLDAPALAHEVYDLSLGEVWDARLVAEAFARECPGFRWRAVGDPAEANIAYHAPLDSERHASPSTRLRRELGVEFEFPPARAAEDYARWALAHRRLFAVRS